MKGGTHGRDTSCNADTAASVQVANEATTPLLHYRASPLFSSIGNIYTTSSCSGQLAFPTRKLGISSCRTAGGAIIICSLHSTFQR